MLCLQLSFQVDEETAKASMEVEKPTSSWDSGGTTLEVNCEKPETGLTGAVHPVAAKRCTLLLYFVGTLYYL